jgi:hypothetical protein
MQRINDAEEFVELFPIMVALLDGIGRHGDAADPRGVHEAGLTARGLVIENAVVDVVAVARLLRELDDHQALHRRIAPQPPPSPNCEPTDLKSPDPAPRRQSAARLAQGEPPPAGLKRVSRRNRSRQTIPFKADNKQSALGDGLRGQGYDYGRLLSEIPRG